MTTVPHAPTAVTPSRSGSSAALVTFSPPDDDGGSGITLYTVRAEATPGDVEAKVATGQNSPIQVTGLQNGNTYSFTVKATNADGDSESSEAATLTVGAAPSPPLAVSASRESGKSTITFNEPEDDGGAPVTHYTVTAINAIIPARGGQSASAGSSPITITGLSNGDGYIFSVTATNAYGTSEAANSGVVTPGGGDLSQPQAPWPDAIAITVHKRIGPLQLQDELKQALHQDCQVAVVNDSPFSADGTIFLIPGTLDEEAVQAVVDDHNFDPNYGTPSYLTEFNDLLRKINEMPEYALTNDDIQVAVKGMLARIPLTLNS